MSSQINGIVQFEANVRTRVLCVRVTVFHEYLAGIIFSEFVILEISRVFNLAIPKNRAG